ncbi:hypothetical protein ACFL1M_01700 [Patescibacteria group bacterium]
MSKLYQETVNSFQKAITTSATAILTQVLNFLPVFFGAIIILAVGFMLGKWIKKLVIKSLELINLTKLVKNTAVTKFLNKADVKHKIEEVLGEILRWLTILVFFIASINILGLVTVSEFLSNILWYIPKVISASLVLAVGVLIAGWVESVVKGTVGTAALATGRLLGKVAGYVVVVFASLAAVSELGIAERFINTLFIGLVAMLSIGLGLAFGLGSKDLVSKILNEWYKNLKKELK